MDTSSAGAEALSLWTAAGLTEKEFVNKANATEYGLAAYTFTREPNRGLRMAELLQAGTIGLSWETVLGSSRG
jgi:acyl-CoA reductase-like NAD-dependent aldehyde dehydrogenase